jgi:hypothetical protein
MAISLVSVSTVAETTANDDVTVTAPSGIQDGDLLLAFYSNWSSDNVTAEPVALTGFTTWCSKYASGGGDTTDAILYRIASGEGGNYSITGSSTGTSDDCTGSMAVLRGVDTGTPIDEAYVEANHFIKQQNTITPTPKSIDTNTANAWVIVFAHHVFANDCTDVTQPSGYTEAIVNVNGNGKTIQVSYIDAGTAGTETPGQMTFVGSQATDDTAIFTIAVRPSTAANKEILVPTGPWR